MIPATNSLDETNPFRVTECDADVLKLREEERIERKNARDENKNLKVWQKSKSGTKSEISRGTWIREFIRSIEEEKTKEGDNIPQQKRRVNSILERLDKYFSDIKPEERESTTDFIAKRREMFLLQMSLNIKKSEIKKLHEKACVKEEALKRSEQMLEEDAAKFDAFLKENDKKAQVAVREAEKKSKRNMEKMQEIKRVNQQIQATQSTISRHKESLDECLKYKLFLGQLTPNDWVQEQKELKKKRQKERRKTRIQNKKKKWRQEMETKAREEKEIKNSVEQKSRRRRRGRRDMELNQIQKDSALLTDIPKEPDFEDEILTSSDEELSIYFRKPDNLLEILSSFEEENLFLIQNTQEAEQSLDELVRKFNTTKSEIQRKEEIQQKNILQLKQTIDNRKNTLKDTKTIGNKFKSQIVEEPETVWLNDLNSKIHQVYHRCGYGDAGSIPSMLFMISNIEAKMEEIMSRIDDIPHEYMKKAEKVKDKKRREWNRAQQQAAQAKSQEERNRKALERSMQPPKKMTEKKIMYRSYLPKNQNVKQERNEEIQEELDEIKFLT